MKKHKNQKKLFVSLHIILLIYSLVGCFSKTAALSDFLSIKFIVCYAAMILMLGIYAIAWQQIIRRMQLTTAYANKAVTVVWGIVWGLLFFGEDITVGKVIGAVFIMAGIVLYAAADNTDSNNGEYEEGQTE